MRRFRRTFRLAEAAEHTLAIHISADSRYLLYCNGHYAGRGPAKGDVRHQFYHTHDLSGLLQTGENTVAILVLDFSPVTSHPPALGAPTSVMVYRGGLAVDGRVLDSRGNRVESLASNGNWRVQVDHSYRFQSEQDTYGGFTGYYETYHAAEAPRGWTTPDFDDSDWPRAEALMPALRFEARRDTDCPYGLMPAMTPPLEEGEPTPFGSVFQPGGAEAASDWRDLIAGEGTLEIPPRSTMEAILDVGKLTTGFPMLDVAGGAGGEIRLTYAEALRLPHGTPDAKILGGPGDLKSVAIGYADETTGWTFDKRGAISGWCDIFHPNGERENLEPLHWRTFRYIGVRVETGDAPLTVHGFRHRFCAYPYRVDASFACSNPKFAPLWDISLRTMRLCSHETFEDCPYYEQMQYAGDSAITSALAMATTGDTALSKQAVLHFAWSLLPEGITQSRYPSRIDQVIPSWSLHWITLVYDYLRYSGDRDTVRAVMPAMRAVMDWFRSHRDGTRLPARLPYWNTTDWCPQWDRGQPPGWNEGPTCVISCQFLRALRELRWLEEQTSHVTISLDEIETTAAAINEQFWSEEEGLYMDRPGGPETSQYGNAWAVHGGAADEARVTHMLTRYPHDSALAPASFFGMHYVFEALQEMGAFDRAAPLLAPWWEMVSKGLSTWAEETKYWRSLCHAWSAHPALHCLRGVLGIRPASPGFGAIRVAPETLGLSWAKGHMPTPHGPIHVEWKIEADAMEIRVESPRGIPLEIVAPTGEKCHSQGGMVTHQVDLSATPMGQSQLRARQQV